MNEPLQLLAQPGKDGLYVAYVSNEITAMTTFAQKKLLIWHDGQWSYPGSDQVHRDPVVGCIGPLPPLRVKS